LILQVADQNLEWCLSFMGWLGIIHSRSFVDCRSPS
jgi:hypothetical protein